MTTVDYIFSDERVDLEPPSLDLGWERAIRSEQPDLFEPDSPDGKTCFSLGLTRRRKREWPIRAARDPYAMQWYTLPNDEMSTEPSEMADALVDCYLARGRSAALSLWRATKESYCDGRSALIMAPNEYDVGLALDLWAQRIVEEEAASGRTRAGARIVRACEHAYQRLLAGGSAADYERLERLLDEVSGRGVARVAREPENVPAGQLGGKNGKR